MAVRRALVVEDDASARQLLTVLLSRMGFEVEATDDGRTALTLLDEGPLALVCVDIGLPTISGFDVCEAVRRHPHGAQAPILMTTGRWMPQDRALAIALGANGYLLKPFTPGQFRAAVQALAGEPVEAPRREAR